MPKKSSIEWLLNAIEGLEYNYSVKQNFIDYKKNLKLIKKTAYELHKKEIIEAYNTGTKDFVYSDYLHMRLARNYYKNKYEEANEK